MRFFRAFDSFGHDAVAEPQRKIDDCGNELPFDRTFVELHHECSVDLDLVDAE